jgi:hypothetical protein
MDPKLEKSITSLYVRFINMQGFGLGVGLKSEGEGLCYALVQCSSDFQAAAPDTLACTKGEFYENVIYEIQQHVYDI